MYILRPAADPLMQSCHAYTGDQRTDFLLRNFSMRNVWSGVLFAFFIVSIGCGKSANSRQQSQVFPADSDRFPHALHTGDRDEIRSFKGRGLGCIDCHPQSAVLEGKPSRPGKNNHAPCDSCHADEFYKAPGAFCRNCHTKVAPRVKGETRMQPYPERGLARALASNFSHKQHLDSSSMEAALGFHVGCSDCHERDKNDEPAMPAHAQCSSCHQQKPKVKKKLGMANCAGCHRQKNVDLKRGRQFIVGDLTFSHSTHVKDIKGSSIQCSLCHNEIPESEKARDTSIPEMQRCAICHENAERSPDRVRMDNCATCHQKIVSGRPPPNHLVNKGLPEDHNLEFRRNHEEQAAAKNSNCRFCHEEINGEPENSCFQCHTLMRPRDHNLAWRDDAHGREAAAETDRCATCHQPDYCVACHSVPPRSHQPFTEYREGGHGDDARFNLRSCFACHTFESTCSNCHRRFR